MANNKRAYRPLVYICSPLSGDVDGNMEKARQYCRFALEQGQIPLAPHLMFPQFMDDEDAEERELATEVRQLLLPARGLPARATTISSPWPTARETCLPHTGQARR